MLRVSVLKLSADKGTADSLNNHVTETSSATTPLAFNTLYGDFSSIRVPLWGEIKSALTGGLSLMCSLSSSRLKADSALGKQHVTLSEETESKTPESLCL